MRRSLEKGDHDEFFKAKLELAATNTDFAGQLHGLARARPHAKNFCNIRMWIEKLMQEQVEIAPISFATYVAVYAETCMANKNITDWCMALLCKAPESQPIAFDLERPAFWQISEFSQYYDNDDMGDEDDATTSSGGAEDTQNFKRKALRAGMSELTSTFLGSWCCDSFMSLVRQDLQQAGDACQAWLEATADLPKWERSCHKNLQQAVACSRVFAEAFLAVTGRIPFTQETYKSFMTIFVSPKSMKGQAAETLRLMASTVRKNETWPGLEKQTLRCAASELESSSELQEMLAKVSDGADIPLDELQKIHERWLELQGLVRNSTLRTLETALASRLLEQCETITRLGDVAELALEHINTIEFIGDALLNFEHSPEFARTQAMQATCLATAQKWREQQKQKALQSMSEGAPEVKTKALVETLDALRSSALDRLVLEALLRQLHQSLKEVAQNPDAEKDAGSQLLTNLSAVQEALLATLSSGESQEPYIQIDYVFIGKLFANGLAIRTSHLSWKSSGTKSSFLTFVKAHNHWSDLTITNEMHKKSCFYKCPQSFSKAMPLP